MSINQSINQSINHLFQGMAAHRITWVINDLSKMLLKSYHIDWSVILVNINRVHLWLYNKRAKCSRKSINFPSRIESSIYTCDIDTGSD